MDKQYESGRTILKVIAFIVIIGLLLTLIVRICQKTGASADLVRKILKEKNIKLNEYRKQLLQRTIPICPMLWSTATLTAI